jgi:hypothetical protein
MALRAAPRSRQVGCCRKAASTERSDSDSTRRTQKRCGEK